MKSIKTVLTAIILLFSICTHSQIKINEILASNSLIQDPDYKQNSDCIELYNAGTITVNLGGYFLTDNLHDSVKWKIPANTFILAKQYLVFWADGNNNGLHTSFKLSGSGEQVGLFSSNGFVIDSITFGTQLTDVSFGRNPNGGTIWNYFSQPTMGASNTGQVFQGVTAPPVFSLSGGFYTSTQNVTISHPINGTAIRYTTDGTEPSVSSTLYSAPFNVTQTTVVRARAFETGKIQSKVINKTFFINAPNHTLPVVSLSSAPANFFDAATGFYVNINQEWEKPVGIELYQIDKKLGFAENAGASLYGSGTRSFAEKSMSINFRSEYGAKEIDYKLFDQIKRDHFSAFVLRNSGNDWLDHNSFLGTMFLDGLQHTILNGRIDLDLMAYRPAVLYINGQYWGIENIREKQNEDYIDSYHPVNQDSLDIIKLHQDTLNELVAGDSMDYYNLIQYLKSNDLTIQQNYDYVKSKIDYKEYINYLLIENYYANFDWPENNNKFWKSQRPGSKWRWMVYDLDFGFNGQAWGGSVTKFTNWCMNAFKTADRTDANPWSNLLYRKLILNTDFKNEFINQYAYHVSTTFNPSRVIPMIDSISGLIAGEMPRHIAKWGTQGGISSMASWNTALQDMRNFGNYRPEYAMNTLTNRFGLTATDLTIKADKLNGGKVLLNENILTNNNYSATFFIDVPIRFNAIANTGYKFSGWKIKRSLTSKTTYVAKGATWKYLSNGSNQGTTWRDISFNDNTWLSGVAQLGYGEADEATVIGYGGNASNKYITYYFRKAFNVVDPKKVERLMVKIVRDDGAIIYINGKEAKRTNMPTGTVTSSTLANFNAGNDDEISFYEFELNPVDLVTGNNVVAVEIHQCDVTSPDVSFDLELTGSVITGQDSTTTATNEITVTPKGITEITAYFDPYSPLYINEVAPDNLNLKRDNFNEYEDWIELYNPNNTPVNIAGMYLTDGLNNPMKWQIPSTHLDSTTIPPKGFLLLWADNETSEGVLHLGFKLNKDGDEVGVSEMRGTQITFIDTISWNFVNFNQTYGRFPDGNGAAMEFQKPTPGAKNDSSKIQSIDPQMMAKLTKVYPNPANSFVTISLPDYESSIIEITDVSGKILENISLSQQSITIDISKYSGGVYFIKITNTSGTSIHKLIKN